MEGNVIEYHNISSISQECIFYYSFLYITLKYVYLSISQLQSESCETFIRVCRSTLGGKYLPSSYTQTQENNTMKSGIKLNDV